MKHWWCRWFGHAWWDTHTNRWFIPTRRVCARCELVQTWQGGIGGDWHEGENPEAQK